MDSRIEVGDVFTHIADPTRDFVCVSIQEDGHIVDESGYPNNPRNCKLVRKADPYAGITLPEPPAGYRLAKWGEEIPGGSLWFDCDQKGRNGTWEEWGQGGNEWQSQVPVKDAWLNIYAIPIVSEEFCRAAEIEANTPINSPAPSPLKSWQFREVPWVVPQPKTLADCVPNTPVVSPNDAGHWHVVYRVGSQVFCQGSGEYFSAASDAKFVRYLDPPPPKPLSLDDVPDGRCLQVGEDSPTSFPVLYWKAGNTWWISDVRTGEIKPAYPPCEKWTVTNYIAEFRGPE